MSAALPRVPASSMQLEITLTAAPGADYAASDLGYLLHKHPGRLHERSTSAGTARVFFTEADARRARAVLALDVDALGLARRHQAAGAGDAPLARYVSDRAFVANSFLSVAMTKVYAQSMGGRSKERQALAERAPPFTARIVPVAGENASAMARTLFEPLGYTVDIEPIAATPARETIALTLSASVRLDALLRHLYVLVPVLDDAKHWWVDADEVGTLLDKAGDWLGAHPARELIARRALKRRRALADELLERLDAAPERPSLAREPGLEKPLNLHERRLEHIAATLSNAGVTSVIDLGCGEGRLLERLVRNGAFKRLLGVDPDVRSLARAAVRLHLESASDALSNRVALVPGSLSYADRTWRDFDAVVLSEVIEHVDPERHAALERILFADARPSLVLVTTPNADYNARFEKLSAGEFRHPDHRFEWGRNAFRAWCERVGDEHGYTVRMEPLGDEDPELGGPSQMGVFTR